MTLPSVERSDPNRLGASMHWLPRISLGSQFWYLPLSDASAADLSASLLASSDRACPQRIAALLEQDPSLTLWTTCRAHLRDGLQLKTCASAANWLAENLLADFDLEIQGDGQGKRTDPSVSARYAELATQGVVAATLAKELSAAYVSLDPRQTHFVGLLHAAPRWLDPSRRTEFIPFAAEDASSCLPDWLRQLLSDVTQDSPDTSEMPSCVRRSIHIASGGPELQGLDEATANGWTAKRIVGISEQTRKRWLATHADAYWRLDGLLSKLRKLDRLERQFEQALESEKLDAMKELAYGASHEINNPLANISARAQTLLKDESDPERRRKLAAINSQAFRAHEMISDLMLFARPPKLSRQRTDLVELIDQVIGELASEAHLRETSLQRRCSLQPVMVLADKVQLGVALRAMCTNSLEALGTGGHVQLEARAPQRPGQTSWAQLTVSDDGPGISSEVRRHLFDPFYSGREAGRGLGFGLSKCWRIVTDHGGRIEVDSPAGQGATFTLYLPC